MSGNKDPKRKHARLLAFLRAAREVALGYQRITAAAPGYPPTAMELDDPSAPEEGVSGLDASR